MNNRWITLFGFAALLITAGGAYLVFDRQNQARYRTSPIDRGSIITAVSVAGTVNALERTEVSSQLSGQIREVLVDFNDKIARGQVLARLDPRSYQARVREAEADLEMARAEVATREGLVQQRTAELANAQASRSVIQAEVLSSQAKAKEARLELERLQAINAKTLLSARELAQAKAEYDSRAAMLEAARARIKVQEAAILAAQASLRIAESELVHAQAELRQRQAALEQAEVDLQRSEIRSPMDGVVIRRDVEAGQTVAASLQAPTLFTIAGDLAEMILECQVDEADIGRIRPAQEVSFTVDAYPGRRFSGQVVQIRKAPTTFQSVVTYSVMVSVANRDQALFPGMTAIARIQIEVLHKRLRVPNAALRFLPSGREPLISETRPDHASAVGLPATVWTLDADGLPQPVPIRTGATDERYTALLAGPLQEGDRVITAEMHDNR